MCKRQGVMLKIFSVCFPNFDSECKKGVSVAFGTFGISYEQKLQKNHSLKLERFEIRNKVCGPKKLIVVIFTKAKLPLKNSCIKWIYY